MGIEIKSLERISMDMIADCFNEAFSDYFVQFEASPEYLSRRWRGARVRYDLSFGAFESDRLVGFMVQGIGRWEGKRTAYNAGTGVIPSHRGRRLVEQMYHESFPALKKENIERLLLEVITENSSALKAYSRLGFSPHRRLKCFAGMIDPSHGMVSNAMIRVKAVEETNWKMLQAFTDFHPSWENSKEALLALAQDFECREIYLDDDLCGIVVLNPVLGYIPQFGFSDKNPDLAGSVLFGNVAIDSPGIRINNLDERDKKSLRLLRKLGIKSTLDQFEMSMDMP